MQSTSSRKSRIPLPNSVKHLNDSELSICIDSLKAYYNIPQASLKKHIETCFYCKKRIMYLLDLIETNNIN